MSKLNRFTQLIFGSTAGSNQIAEFGSYAASAPQTYSGSTITPAIVQTLANYLEGWQGAVIGQNSPALEDMNALCYLYAYQLAYLFQEGVSEYDSATTYYQYSMVNNNGTLYVSVYSGANLGHALTNSTYWQPYETVNSVVTSFTFSNSPYSILAADTGKTFDIDVTNGIFELELPSPVIVGSGFNFKVVDSKGLFSTYANYAYLAPNASELIVGVNANYNMQAGWGAWEVYTDGLNWFLR